MTVNFHFYAEIINDKNILKMKEKHTLGAKLFNFNSIL